MSSELIKNLGELNGSVKNYLEARIDLVKLTLLEKTARLATCLINYLVVVLFSVMVVVFAAAAFAVWYGQVYNNYVDGVLIAGGVIILICLIFILMRRQIITNSIIRNFSEVLFEDDNEKH
jgi:hypothetical protein